MFRVGTGLDSQILAILKISQIRTSFSQSKSLGLASNFMERLVNSNSGK
jgi:glutamyl-tRNA reductase